MFLLTILSLITLSLIMVVIGAISLFGTVGVILSSDIIVCIGVLTLIIYFIIRRKTKKR